LVARLQGLGLRPIPAHRLPVVFYGLKPLVKKGLSSWTEALIQRWVVPKGRNLFG
jgi:hypothetical protein